MGELHPFWQRVGQQDFGKPNMSRAMRKAMRTQGRELADAHEIETAHRIARIEPELIYMCRDCEWEARRIESPPQRKAEGK